MLTTEEAWDTVKKWDGMHRSPSPENRRKPDGIRMLQNSFVETVFTTAHPLSIVLWWGPFVGWTVYRTTQTHTLRAGAGLFLLGVFLWTLIEYSAHRWLYHAVAPPATDEGKFSRFVMHGYYHEFPNDKKRLVAPLVMSVPFAVVTALVYYFVIGENAWLPVLGGTFIGYLVYDWIHYYTHHFHPRRGLGKWLRDYHLAHHFTHHDSHFGISSPLWDLMFGSYRPRHRRQTRQE